MSYLPVSDSGLLSWSANFVAQVNSIGALNLGLTDAEATTYALYQTTYASAYESATNPSTRGTATIQAKNEAKAALVAESRKMAMAATSHLGTTDAQRLALGLTVRDREPTPVPVPETSPTVQITGVDAWTVHLRLKNGQSTSRAKPAGVTGATVFSYVGDTPPVSVDDWKFEGNVTTTITKVVFPDSLTPGTTVWLTAFWFNTRAESGPAAVPVSTKINYGGMNLPQAA